jgi:hypothetical protein
VEVSVVGVAAPEKTMRSTHESEAFIGARADITVNGVLSLASESTNTAGSDEVNVSLGIAEIDLTELTVEIAGATRAYVDEGAVVQTDGLNLSATSLDNDAEAKYVGAAVGVVTVESVNTNATISHDVETFVGARNGASPSAFPVGSLTVLGSGLSMNAESNDWAFSQVTGGGAGVVSVGISDPRAEIIGATRAYVGEGAQINATSIDVTATASERKAEARSLVVEIAVGAGGSADTNAKVTGTVDAHIASSSSNQTNLTVAGPVTVHAVGNTNVVAEGDVGSGGAIGIAVMESIAEANTTTAAYVGASALISAYDLSVRAESTERALSDSLVGSGAVIGGRGTKSNAKVLSATTASISENVDITLTSNEDDAGSPVVYPGSLLVEAYVARAEADAKAKSYGGGVIDVGAAFAQAQTKPTVTASIGNNATVAADGDVVVRATADSIDTNVPFDDYIQDVNTTDDTITFLSHGLTDGDTVRYVEDGGSLSMPGGDIGDGREITVLRVDDDTIRLGVSFAAGDVDTGAVISQPDPWQPNHDYAPGDWVRAIANNDYYFTVVQDNGDPGLSGGSEPAWSNHVKDWESSSTADETTDGDLVWSTRYQSEYPPSDFGVDGDRELIRFPVEHRAQRDRLRARG